MRLQIPKTVIIIAVLLLAIVGGYFLLRGSYQAPTSAPTTPKETPEVTVPEEEVSPPTSQVKEFTVSGSEFSFSPSSISVAVGERVKIIFRNDGRAPHNLIVEGLGVGIRTIGGGQTDIIEFTAPASGTYTFICSVPGHRAAGMEGSLKIE